MDEFGIQSQVIYPNSIGIGGQNLFNKVKDTSLVLLCVSSTTTPWPRSQEESDGRLLPMPIMPAWSIDECVREASAARRWGTAA